MRRRSKNSKAANEVKTAVPRKSTRQSSRRRKRSSSRSDNENDTQNDNVQNQLEIQADADQEISLDKSTENDDETSIDSKNMKSNDQTENKEFQEESKDKDEENNKGKSTGITESYNEQSTNNIEPETENENIQGSNPSSNDNDVIVKKINVTRVEENHDHNDDNTHIESTEVDEKTPIESTNLDEKTPTKLTKMNEKTLIEVAKDEDDTIPINEPTQVNDTPSIETIESSKEERTKPKSSDEQDTFQSEYTEEKSQNTSQDAVNAEMKTQQNVSATNNMNEKKLLERKRITLKRSSERTRRETSPLEDGEIQEPKEKPSKKISLKRQTTDETNSDFIDKIIINRRSSGGDDNHSERRKRQSSFTEENTLTVVEKPRKPSKTVKLIRTISLESQDSESNQRLRKQYWGKSEFLEHLPSNVYKIDVDAIKIVCPSVEFLKESELKLDEEPREQIKSESDLTKNEEEKSGDTSEKEQSEEENSTEDQKFEANPNIIALNRKISIVDDTAAKMQPPPSPAKNPPSEILFITNLVRPFTVKQLKELLERTGTIREDGFWTDRIKSKCYVHYECVEEAETTRNALHGVFWPIGNGKQLVIDYASQEEMEKAKNPVPLPAPVSEKIPDKENREPETSDDGHKARERGKEQEHDREERRRDTSGREWDKTKEEPRRRHSRSKSRERARKHSRRSYTPEDHNRKKYKSADDSVPQKLMDDLFLKTKTTPSIYWQPLSPQEIATKQQQRLVRMEEHKRRIEENRGRRERDRRGTFRRR